jgi:two-component system, NtrC family, sensor kinase
MPFFMRTAAHSAPYRRSIGTKLWQLFALLFLILGGAAYFGMSSLFELHEALHDVERAAKRQSAVLRLASAVRDQYAHMAHTLILGNDTHSEYFASASASVKNIAADVARRARSKPETELVAAVESENDRLDRIFQTALLPAVRSQDRQAGALLHEDVLATVTRAQNSTQKLSELSEQAIKRVGAHAEIVEHRAIQSTLIFLATAILFAIGMGLYLYRSLTVRIRRLAAGTAQLAAGDLDVQLSVVGEDEVADLAARFNAMTTSLKEHQRRLLQSEKLAALGRVAAGFAHEINNPLGVILGYVKLLRRKTEGPIEADLAIVEQEAERCHEVVEDLLDLTRSPPAENEEVDLRAMAEDVAATLKAAAIVPGASIVIEGSGKTRGSRRKLRQVVHNLIKNALEANEAAGGGAVTVRIGTTGSGQLVMTVIDNGPGIRAEHRRIVFEPFFTTKPKGTGLGLAVSRAIARAHGGDLEVAEAAGRGAAFQLTLPRAEATL